MRHKIDHLYLYIQFVSLKLRYKLLGFENANYRLGECDSRLLPDALRWLGAHVGQGCVFESPLIINAKQDYRNLAIGNGCYIGKSVLLDLKGKIVIGDNVTISMGCSLISHLDVGGSSLSKLFPCRLGEVRIGSNCYLGANAVVLPDVELGQRCLVAAGAVVSRAQRPHSLVAGVPARAIRTLDQS